MNIPVRQVILLRFDNGRSPFEDWLESLDPHFMRIIDSRITRLRNGNFGDHKGVGGGVFELRIHVGPGFRVYYGMKGNDLVILLGGGDKDSQEKDISKAKNLLIEYKNEN